MNTFEQIRTRSATIQAQIKVLQAEAADQLKPLLQQFIVDNPAVEAVRWVQYTPYFNDGDACTFRACEPCFKLVGGEESDGDREDGFLDLPGPVDYRERNYYEDFVKACPDHNVYLACKSLEKELGGLDDALQQLFGDHVQVTVTATGVEVDEYEHD
jgi:hypothetical protein